MNEHSWRKPHSEEHHNLYSSPNIIRMVKLRRMRLAGRREMHTKSRKHETEEEI
jgi:hypothetical protein